jgi:hypothetical protein
VRNLLTSLSLTSAAVLVAIVSGIAALAYGRLGRVIPRWLAAVSFPFALSYVIYWAPVWLGSSDVEQYYAWELLGDAVPCIVGLIVSALFTVPISGHAKKHA